MLLSLSLCPYICRNMFVYTYLKRATRERDTVGWSQNRWRKSNHREPLLSHSRMEEMNKARLAVTLCGGRVRRSFSTLKVHLFLLPTSNGKGCQCAFRSCQVHGGTVGAQRRGRQPRASLRLQRLRLRKAPAWNDALTETNSNKTGIL